MKKIKTYPNRRKSWKQLERSNHAKQQIITDLTNKQMEIEKIINSLNKTHMKHQENNKTPDQHVDEKRTHMKLQQWRTMTKIRIPLISATRFIHQTVWPIKPIKCPQIKQSLDSYQFQITLLVSACSWVLIERFMPAVIKMLAQINSRHKWKLLYTKPRTWHWMWYVLHD